jgi:hypothetical protein
MQCHPVNFGCWVDSNVKVNEAFALKPNSAWYNQTPCLGKGVLQAEATLFYQSWFREVRLMARSPWVLISFQSALFLAAQRSVVLCLSLYLPFLFGLWHLRDTL